MNTFVLVFIITFVDQVLSSINTWFSQLSQWNEIYEFTQNSDSQWMPWRVGIWTSNANDFTEKWVTFNKKNCPTRSTDSPQFCNVNWRSRTENSELKSSRDFLHYIFRNYLVYTYPNFYIALHVFAYYTSDCCKWRKEVSAN